MDALILLATVLRPWQHAGSGVVTTKTLFFRVPWSIASAPELTALCMLPWYPLSILSYLLGTLLGKRVPQI